MAYRVGVGSASTEGGDAASDLATPASPTTGAAAVTVDRAPGGGTRRDGVGILRAAGRALLWPPRALAALLPLAWAGLLWRFSSVSDDVDLELSLPEWLLSIVHDLAHPAAFGLLALLLVPLLPRRGTGEARWVAWSRSRGGVLFAVVLAYGLVDEWHQSLVPGRVASLLDVLSDVVGAGAVLAVVAYLSRPDANGRGLALRLGLGLGASLAAAAVSSAFGWITGGGLWPGS